DVSRFSCTESSPPEPYTLSLHDALPILGQLDQRADLAGEALGKPGLVQGAAPRQLDDDIRVEIAVMGAVDDAHSSLSQLGQDLIDRKSTRLNSSHSQISYAVFCLKKKKK